jgi:hypothetical protein
VEMIPGANNAACSSGFTESYGAFCAVNDALVSIVIVVEQARTKGSPFVGMV